MENELKPLLPKKEKAKPKVSKKTWKGTMFIPPSHTVLGGEEVTKEQRDAWKAWSDTNIKDYIE